MEGYGDEAHEDDEAHAAAAVLQSSYRSYLARSRESSPQSTPRFTTASVVRTSGIFDNDTGGDLADQFLKTVAALPDPPAQTVAAEAAPAPAPALGSSVPAAAAARTPTPPSSSAAPAQAAAPAFSLSLDLGLGPAIANASTNPDPDPSSRAILANTHAHTHTHTHTHAPSSPLSPNSSPHKHLHQLSTALLSEQGGLLPLLADSKETKSARPKALLAGVSHRVQQLLLELSAIKIQAQFRRHRASIRVAALAYRARVKLASLRPLAETLLEQVCLTMCVAVAAGVHREYHSRDREKQEEEAAVLEALAAILREEGGAMVEAVVGEAIKESVTAYIQSRPAPTTNPLVALVLALIEETSQQMAAEVGRETVKEAVVGYLEQRHALVGFSIVCDALLGAEGDRGNRDRGRGSRDRDRDRDRDGSRNQDSDSRDQAQAQAEDKDNGWDGRGRDRDGDRAWAVAIAEEALVEVLEADAVTGVVEEVLAETAGQTVTEVLSGMRAEYDALQEERDRAAIATAAAKLVGAELAISHLLMHLADGLDSLFLELYLRDLTRQVLTAKIVALADQAERARGGLFSQPLLRFLFGAVSYAGLQDRLVAEARGEEGAALAAVFAGEGRAEAEAEAGAAVAAAAAAAAGVGSGAGAGAGAGTAPASVAVAAEAATATAATAPAAAQSRAPFGGSGEAGPADPATTVTMAGGLPLPPALEGFRYRNKFRAQQRMLAEAEAQARREVLLRTAAAAAAGNAAAEAEAVAGDGNGTGAEGTGASLFDGAAASGAAASAAPSADPAAEAGTEAGTDAGTGAGAGTEAEAEAAATATEAGEGAGAAETQPIVTEPAEPADPAEEGHLVHQNGQSHIDTTAADSVTGPAADPAADPAAGPAATAEEEGHLIHQNGQSHLDTTSA